MKGRGTNLRRIVLIAQALLSVTLLGWMIWSVDWRAMIGAVREVSPPLFVAGVMLYYFGIVLSCYKWQRILWLEGIHEPFWRLVRWYMIGSFASNFLPSDIGGDMGRGYLAARSIGRPLAVARSIVVERLSGLIMMLVLALVGAGMLLGVNTLFAWTGGIILVIGVCALLALFAAPTFWLQPAFENLWKRLPPKLSDALTQSMNMLREASRQPGQLALILLLSFVFQIVAGIGLWLNLLALGAVTSAWQVVLCFALANTLSLLPISVNGWGIREGALVALITPLGVSSPVALAGALYSRALVLICSLAGAAPALLLRRQRSRILPEPRA